MDEQDQNQNSSRQARTINKKSIFKRWWFWLILIVILGLATIGMMYFANNQEKQTNEKKSAAVEKTGKTVPFISNQLADANAALAKGVKIEDPQNDWHQFPEGSMQPDGRPDNSDPYPLGWTDIKSLSFGVDDKYLYFKFEFWNAFPQKGVTHNGDYVDGLGAKIEDFTFTNAEGKSDFAELTLTTSYYRQGKKPADAITGLMAMITPAGQDEYLEVLYKVNSVEGLISGGEGTDYMLAAYPLSEFSGLKMGDEVVFHGIAESGSEKYHHEALDQIFSVGLEKQGEGIRWRLGEDTYEVIKMKTDEKK